MLLVVSLGSRPSLPLYPADDFFFMQGSFLYHWQFVNVCHLIPSVAVFSALYVLSLTLTPFKLLFPFYRWSLALCLSFARVPPSGAFVFMSLGCGSIVVELTTALSSIQIWSFWMHSYSVCAPFKWLSSSTEIYISLFVWLLILCSFE